MSETTHDWRFVPDEEGRPLLWYDTHAVDLRVLVLRVRVLRLGREIIRITGAGVPGGDPLHLALCDEMGEMWDLLEAITPHVRTERATRPTSI